MCDPRAVAIVSVEVIPHRRAAARGANVQNDLLDTDDVSRSELGGILGLVSILTEADRDGCVPALLERSPRTRGDG
jgi:hypothetical protein